MRVEYGGAWTDTGEERAMLYKEAWSYRRKMWSKNVRIFHGYNISLSHGGLGQD